jgi:hypothetical protein
MKEPVDHILRPTLPWRESAAITECGYDASKVKTLTRPEFFARLKEFGKRRAAMLTCMTCSDAAGRWGTWDDDPRVAVQREIEWERGSAYWRERNDRGQRLKDELLAVASLIESHKDEFLDTIETNAKRRYWLERKAEHERKPKQKRPPLGL